VNSLLPSNFAHEAKLGYGILTALESTEEPWPGHVTCSWPPGQQNRLQARGPSYPQRPALRLRSHGVKTWRHP